MVRPRRVQEHNGGTNSSSSNGSTSKNKKPKKTSKLLSLLSHWRQMLGTVLLSIAIIFGYVGYLETRVNTPFDDNKMVVKSGLSVPEQYWGSYRPGVYFGMKTRDPNSLVAGLMWYFPKKLRPGGDGIRHWCEQGDNLQKYGWIQHDDSSFGVQEIIDGPYALTTSFIKRLGGSHGGDWTARISVDFNPDTTNISIIPENDEVSFIWYAALDEETSGAISPTNLATKLTGIKGSTKGLGEFTMKLTNYSGAVAHESFLSTVAPGLHLLKETVIASLRLAQDNVNSPRRIVLGGELLQDDGQAKMEPNFVAVQLTGQIPFTVDVTFESGSFGTRQDHLVGDTYTKALGWHQSRFVQRFEDTFHLREKGFSGKEIAFAQAALSNMVGGIGYFYGTSKVQSVHTKEPVYYWNAPLYTAVPSRSFFPRGFLWDEGFHGFLITAWDIDLELDIICHWFDLMNVEGWIPREQILGVEASAKVPEEFVVQRNTNANPPTFFLTLRFILHRYSDKLTEGRLMTLERLYPRLRAWFNWFNITQRGVLPGSYRWRGRDGLTNRELNPKTLTSGLDDYPRASHPTDNEYHVDLYCWIAIAADTLSKLANLLNYDGYEYYQTAQYLLNNELMNKLHWSDFAQSYADFGYHTDSVVLKRPKPLPRSEHQNLELIRVTLKNPEYRLVDSTFGYVSLFPFLLEIIDVESINLKYILDNLRNPDKLWTPYGLRSLSKNSPLYMKRNTEHDPPYWRGQIWININFLAVKALKHYANIDGPYQEQSESIYKELRINLINNIIKQYYNSGYIWEQYNDVTGEGSGCKPFTGWSALVVLMMSEQF